MEKYRVLAAATWKHQTASLYVDSATHLRDVLASRFFTEL